MLREIIDAMTGKSAASAEIFVPVENDIEKLQSGNWSGAELYRKYPNEMVSLAEAREMFKHVPPEKMAAAGEDDDTLRRGGFTALLMIEEQFHRGTACTILGRKELTKVFVEWFTDLRIQANESDRVKAKS